MKNIINKSMSLFCHAFNFHYHIDILSTSQGPDEIITSCSGHHLKTKHLAAYIVMARSENQILPTECALERLHSVFYKETESTIEMLNQVYDNLVQKVIILN